jgi:hypothetical protein
MIHIANEQFAAQSPLCYVATTIKPSNISNAIYRHIYIYIYIYFSRKRNEHVVSMLGLNKLWNVKHVAITSLSKTLTWTTCKQIWNLLSTVFANWSLDFAAGKAGANDIPLLMYRFTVYTQNWFQSQLLSFTSYSTLHLNHTFWFPSIVSVYKTPKCCNAPHLPYISHFGNFSAAQF